MLLKVFIKNSQKLLSCKPESKWAELLSPFRDYKILTFFDHEHTFLGEGEELKKRKKASHLYDSECFINFVE